MNKPEFESDLWWRLHNCYAAGWGDGYKAGGVEFDWVDEGFAEFLENEPSVEDKPAEGDPVLREDAKRLALSLPYVRLKTAEKLDKWADEAAAEIERYVESRLAEQAKRNYDDNIQWRAKAKDEIESLRGSTLNDSIKENSNDN
jgi:hypothetical protein